MSESNRRAGVIVVAAVVLVVAGAAVWSGSSLADAKQAAADAAADTAACRQLAGQITTARRSPSGNGNAEADLGPRLERAMTTAEIDAGSLTRVAPQPPRTLGQTGIARRTTQVVLERVSLRQALSFVASLVGDGRQGLTLDSFELTVPVAEGGGVNATPVGDDEWNVDMAVAQAVTISPRR